jgi:hypothetical protein
MIRVQEKIAVGMEVLKTFLLNNYDFKTNKFYELIKAQSEDEYEM